MVPVRRLVVSLLLAGLLGATTVGCATRNGSLEEFCKVLPTTTAVSSLSPEVLGTTDIAATRAQLEKISQDLRRLEQVAPRKVRNDVATVANFAQRFSHELGKVNEQRQPTGVNSNPNGGFTFYDGNASTTYDQYGNAIPDTWRGQWYSNPVFIAFQNVSRSYPGAVSATSDFVSYAQKNCGDAVVPQGYRGDTETLPGGFQIDQNGNLYQPMPPNPGGVWPPPATSDQATTTTTTTTPATAPAPELP